ncbi:FkbM family methyltransferase [Lysinibacillus agricola]|uniref:FkbM family methyltransferase n=1 Tax=Lysinibacillus agricola TaxID=2590012 RepID=A0ABX7ATF5_9BACI|nr:MULTISPECIES: FkbM family methyltransferase [Lysinibacillus]KOS60727.1 hypothetical protein AN161_21525 [Lysinibacillus sp. FJAT-14222]QQP13258.1 FkbM family methyltransferase [Lysinibacillus agricola]
MSNIGDTLVIKQIIENDMPLFIYGSGEVAKFVHEKLKTNNLCVKGYFVDDIFLNSSDKNSILPLSYINVYKEKFNIVMGHIEGYKISKSEIRRRINNINLNDIYYLSEIYNMEELSLKFIDMNKGKFQNIKNLLADEQSRKSLTAYIDAKVYNNYSCLKDIYCEEHYFPKDIISLNENESLIDCGAYIGDTIKDFIALNNNKFKNIIAVEADPINMSILKENYLDERIRFCEVAVFSKKTDLLFDSSENMLSKISEGNGVLVKADKLDNIVKEGEEISFIKMDIEGAEMAALKGAEKIIKTQKPKLAISVYHKRNDLIEIFEYLKGLVPEYKFYFRVHKPIAIDAVLYAVAEF